MNLSRVSCSSFLRYAMPCWARQLKHIFFRCLLFFFQSELPLDPRIPGVWVGGCLGIWHQSWSMGSSATRPWELACRHRDVWLAGDGAVGCGMSNSLPAPSPPNVRLKQTLAYWVLHCRFLGWILPHLSDISELFFGFMCLEWKGNDASFKKRSNV